VESLRAHGEACEDNGQRTLVSAGGKVNMMPKAYIIVNAARRDELPASPEYLATFRDGLVKHGGRLLVGTEEIDRRVGELKIGRLVIAEFADKAAAVAGYEAYRNEAMPLRPGGTHDLIIVEGTA
jgi:uncharacterized protein (DUF1330 family)